MLRSEHVPDNRMVITPSQLAFEWHVYWTRSADNLAVAHSVLGRGRIRPTNEDPVLC